MSTKVIDRDRLKQELVQSLRRTPRTQVVNVMAEIEERLGQTLNALEKQALLELIHEFIVSNVLMTAMDHHNMGWPWLAVTRHGTEVLSAEGPPVYDYEGYLAGLDSRVPDLDPVVRRYVAESLQAYQRNLFYSSMVMLGCASERAVRILIEAYSAAIDHAGNRDRLRARTAKRDISEAYVRFRESFDSTRAQISDASLPRDFDLHVDGVFMFVRLLRNSIVHPDGIPDVTSAMVFANLQQFAYYASSVFALSRYFKTHKITA